MKKNLFKRIFNLTWLVLAAFLTFTACNDDDDDGDDTIILDGLYIMGDATALDDYATTGRFTVTRNEVLQEDRASLYEKYMAISATGSFKIKLVAGSSKKQLGPGADFAVVLEADRVTDDPKVDFWRGTYEENSTEFTVPTDGLYHVIIDTELGKVAIMPVVWGVIGAATPGGWSSSTNFTSSAFDLNTMTFTKTELALTVGDFKYRYSDGWKVALDTILDLGGGDKGVKVNTNFGGAVNALVAGGDNIGNTVPGYYTATMTWTLASGHAATISKTGDLPMVDYSTYNMGFIGDGVLDASDVAVGWSTTYDKKLPLHLGNVYTWTWNGIKIVNTGSFKIRQDDNWDGFVIGYSSVTLAGTGASNLSANGDSNFVPAADGTYDFTLEVDASTEAYTLTVEPSVK